MQAIGKASFSCWFLLIYLRSYQVGCVDRIYFIAREEVNWNFIHGNMENSTDNENPTKTSKKAIYYEYTDKTFTVKKARAEWLGNVGAIIKAEVGDRIVVHYLHKGDHGATKSSIHPVGVTYSKMYEGSVYPYTLSHKGESPEGSGKTIHPGGQFKYIWEVRDTDGPAVDDTPCVASPYFSAARTLNDEIDSGLVGFLLVCKKGVIGNEADNGIDRQFFVYLSTTEDMDNFDVKYQTINGYHNNSLPGLIVCQGERIIWHIMSMGGISDVRTLSVAGHTLFHRKHTIQSVAMYSGRTVSVEMLAGDIGSWSVKSNVPEDKMGGMTASLHIEDCKKEQHNIWMNGFIRRYYIAAEEVYWNYGNYVSGEKVGMLKKALYAEYTDKTFAIRKEKTASEQHLGLLGPVIRAEVGDLVKVVFFNNASKPFSIFANGVRDQRYLEAKTVAPNEIKTYYWTIPEHMGPSENDPPCLTHTYGSDVDTSDLDSGLIGPLLVCRLGELGEDGRQKSVSNEFFFLFNIGDESKSYYWDENNPLSDSDDTNVDIEIYSLVHSINGFINGSIPGVNVCQGENVSWHMLAGNHRSEYGESINFHIVHFQGTAIKVPLFPGSTETIFTEMTETDFYGLIDRVEVEDFQRELKLNFDTHLCVVKTLNLPMLPRTYYIYIEERNWQYSEDLASDSEYKKVTYKETSNSAQDYDSAKETSLEFMGPILVVKPGEIIKIELINRANRKYSICLDGISSYTESGELIKKGKGVAVGAKQIYIWKIPHSFGPTKNEADCKAYIYYSDVDDTKDLHSGLFGPLLVCRHGNSDYDTSKHTILLFATIDENMSWYMSENQRTDEPKRVINGLIHRKINMGLSNKTYLHLLCLGRFVSMHFHGGHITRFYNEMDHMRSYSWRATSNIVDLYPGNAETVLIQLYKNNNWLIRNLILGEDLEGLFEKFSYGIS